MAKQLDMAHVSEVAQMAVLGALIRGLALQVFENQHDVGLVELSATRQDGAPLVELTFIDKDCVVVGGATL